MSNTRQSLLSDRAVILVSGEDAREFLQGLITNDINKVSDGNAIFAALLTPQGKFLYDFFIMEHEGKFLLDVAKATQLDLVKRLTMYKLRSKVEIALQPDMQVGAKWGNGVEADVRLPELGARMIGTHLGLEDSGEYDKHRLSLGVPEGGKDLEANAAFPMQWGYDKLNAIDFNKGCYVGQEVTARSKHIGTMRKMVHKIQADAMVLPAPGTPVVAGGKEIGKMAGSAGNIGIALLDIEAAAKGGLTSGGLEIKVEMPKWAAA